MNASQIDAEITNEESHVVPYVSGSIKLASLSAFGELGALALHNNIGTNRSVLIPFLNMSEHQTLRCIGKNERPTHEVDEAFGVRFTTGGVREVNAGFNRIFGAIEDDSEIVIRDFQVNILVPKQSEVGGQIDTRIKLYHYEVLTGDHKTDIASFRSCLKAGSYLQNGHVVEAILASTVMPSWGANEFDLPKGIVDEVKWLGASYLTKNTRGNLFPQLTPVVEQLQRDHDNVGMRESNPHWGALAGLGGL